MEFEAKNLLTKDEYLLLNSHLNHNKIKPKTQINYYFETEDFALKNKGSALRIRMKNKNYTLTLKQPKDDGILETHESITHETAQLWITNKITATISIEQQLSQLNVDRDALQYGGHLQTDRIQFKYLDALIVLDKSSYNNNIDYELEIESSSMTRSDEVMNQLLTTYKIPIRQTVNKIERFYQTL